MLHGSNSRLSLLVVVAVLMPAPATADYVPVGTSIDGKNDTGSNKSDYEIVVKSDTKMRNGTGFLNVNGGPLMQADGIESNGGRTMTFRWDTNIPMNATVEATWNAIEDTYNQADPKASFTPPDGPTDQPTLGWQVTQDGRVFLENAYPSAIQFANLLFYRPSAVDVSYMLALAGSTPPPGGIPGSVSSGIVPAAIGDIPGKLLVAQFPLRGGDFLTARSDNSFVDSGFSTLTVTDGYEHEHPTPEPSSLTLIAIGTFGLCGYGWRRR